MKLKRILFFALALVMAVSMVVLPAFAEEEEELTLLRAVQINELQIVLEFSGPVAINVNCDNYGPFMAIRYLDKKGDLRWDKTINEENDVAMQWAGSFDFVDSAKDRIIWTLDFGAVPEYPVSDLDYIYEFKGDLKAWDDSTVVFILEEVNDTTIRADGKIGNITTPDGAIALSAGKTASGVNYDNMYIEFEYDEDYVLRAPEESSSADSGSFGIADPTASQSESGGAGNGKENNYLLWIIIGAAGVVVVAVVVVVVVRKKKK